MSEQDLPDYRINKIQRIQMSPSRRGARRAGEGIIH